ncbi:MAG: M23 family metallopeptidase [Clostridia bacterium]|nr:M23 family metallopeptidase [Clostridia bacterium]
MKTWIRVALVSFCCWLALGAVVLAATEPATVTSYQSFVFSRGRRYVRKVEFYPDVFAYNHTEYQLQPFSGAVPERFFVVDGQGNHALAPIVLDVTDAMRIALYGGDVGKVALYYGQYAERIRSRSKKWGYSGIHEGIDFIAAWGVPVYAILGGEVLRAGYGKDNTIAIYNETYNATVLYLHTRNVRVSPGDRIEAGTQIAHEGNRGTGSPYTHVEVRFGRHTSPNPLRNTRLESDLPYDFFAHALGVTPSGREPVTAAALIEAEQMRLAAEAEAEAARLAQEEEEARLLATPTPMPTPELRLLEEVEDEEDPNFGFANPLSTPLPTLPPAP